MPEQYGQELLAHRCITWQSRQVILYQPRYVSNLRGTCKVTDLHLLMLDLPEQGQAALLYRQQGPPWHSCIQCLSVHWCKSLLCLEE